MPLPLADLTQFFWTTTSSWRAPMKIAEARSGNSGLSTRARMWLAVRRTRELLKIDAKFLSSTLLLCSMRTSYPEWSLLVTMPGRSPARGRRGW